MYFSNYLLNVLDQDYLFQEVKKNISKSIDSQVSIDMPGVTKEDVKIKASDSVLSVMAKTKTREYHREFVIPDGVDANGITAKLENGVLTIELPQTAKSKPVTIEVK